MGTIGEESGGDDGEEDESRGLYRASSLQVVIEPGRRGGDRVVLHQGASCHVMIPPEVWGVQGTCVCVTKSCKLGVSTCHVVLCCCHMHKADVLRHPSHACTGPSLPRGRCCSIAADCCIHVLHVQVLQYRSRLLHPCFTCTGVAVSQQTVASMSYMYRVRSAAWPDMQLIVPWVGLTAQHRHLAGRPSPSRGDA